MSNPETICVTIPATYQNLSFIGASVQSLLQDVVELDHVSEDALPTVAFDIELAVHEICNNIIDHAYKHENGHITAYFRYELDRKCVTIDLYDSGPPFDDAAVSPPDLSVPQVGGYGLFLANQLLDEVIYARTKDGNHWHLVKLLGK